MGIDITPGFNMPGWNDVKQVLGVYGGVGPGNVGNVTSLNTKQGKGGSPQQLGAGTVNDNPVSTNQYAGDGGAAAARAAANSQIATINSLLGLIGTKRDAGLGSINSSADEQKRLLAEQRQRTMAGYDTQAVKNQQDQARGYEQVDNFANSSANSLNRVFQGANAGNSSVARLLAPHLVGKAAGSRRTGVTETANENNTNILNARTDAENEFGYSEKDLENQRRNQEQQFRESIVNQESDLLGKKMGLEQNAGMATDGTQGQINERMAQLNALFGQFKPSYNVRATPTKAVDLNSYKVDPAQFRLNQGGNGGETNYFTPQLKKKQQGLA